MGAGVRGRCIFSVGHPFGLARVLRGRKGLPGGPSGASLAVPGVLGQALLPGREDAPAGLPPGASLREGRGCGGSAPAVCCWQHG